MFSSPSVQFLRGPSESVTSENFRLRDTLRAVVSGLEKPLLAGYLRECYL